METIIYKYLVKKIYWNILKVILLCINAQNLGIVLLNMDFTL